MLINLRVDCFYSISYVFIASTSYSCYLRHIWGLLTYRTCILSTLLSGWPGLSGHAEDTWRVQSEGTKWGWDSQFSLNCSFSPLIFFISPPSAEPPAPSSPSNTKLHRPGHKEALSGIPNAHFTYPGWMGKQVSAIYHSFCRKRARRDL